MSDDDDESLSIYDEIEIEDMTFDDALQTYFYPCPCGDRFQIALDDLRDEQDVAVCPSCSLMIRVIFDLVRVFSFFFLFFFGLAALFWTKVAHHLLLFAT